jgi:beta-galactosidase
MSLVVARAQTLAPQPAPTQPATPRERISFDENWRFQKDDPVGMEGRLSYGVLKPWLLPTGNAFVPNSEKSTRPGGNPVENVSYAQPGFDDSGWRQLNVPHDWAIEGPFLKDEPNGTGTLTASSDGLLMPQVSLSSQ